MKIYFSTFITLISLNCAFAQKKDSIRYEILYKVYPQNADTLNSQLERKILFLSTSYALEKNYDLLTVTYNSLIERLEAMNYEKKFGVSATDNVKAMAITLAANEQFLYDNESQTKMLFQSLTSKFFCEIPLGKINWKIFDEYASVAGFSCQKAIGTLLNGNQTTWEVWFTKDIPSAFGLGGMSGLSGLILKGTGGPNKLIFEAFNVNNKPNFFTFLGRPDHTFQKVSKEELDEIKQKYQNEIIELRKKAKQ